MLLCSCSFFKKKSKTDNIDGSSTTGVEFQKSDSTFHPDNVAHSTYRKPDQPIPNMIFIEGGRTLIGFEDLTFTHDKKQNFTATVESFYIDETEIANIHWNEYMHFMRQKSEEQYLASLPDTVVWYREFSFNDFYVDNYLRHPSFRFYPVVGVSWLQATDYCKWRTETVQKNWSKALQETVKDKNSNIPSSSVDSLGNITSNDVTKNPEIKKEDEAVSSPEFRLPTEAEWIYAAQSFSYHQPYIDEKESYKRIFPWDGTNMRNPYGKKKQGYFFANFKRGRGDYSGVAGKNKNDGAIYTNYIYSYPPNDVGLYNMAGNVNEWVDDIYEEFPTGNNKFEVNKFAPKDVDDTTNTDSKDNGKEFEAFLQEERIRVYKGGSWRDNAYWLSPGTRRGLTEDSSSSTIGFRCAMSALKNK